MNRIDVIECIKRALKEEFVLHALGNGWPATGELLSDGPALRVALYAGVMGETHRGRDAEERRFQNPGTDRPIEYSNQYLPLLLGIVEGESEADILLVGFDASRRLGRRTRYSMFAPTLLITNGFREGWATQQNAAGEELIAFRPHHLLRYATFRLNGFGHSQSEEYLLDEIQDLIADLTALLGLGSMEEFAEVIASTTGKAAAGSPDELWKQIGALAVSQGIADGSTPLTWSDAVAVTSVIDERVGLMLSIWEQIGSGSPFPSTHDALVKLIYENPRFISRESRDDTPEMVTEIARTCDAEFDIGDLEVFLSEGQPTLFFYETVRAGLEAKIDTDTGLGEDEEETEEDDDDEDDQEYGQPVNASVDKLQVIQIFHLVSKGRLDIDPAWQRKDVWSLKRKRELVKSLILGIPLPSIILHKKDGGRMSIIDGKQRLTAIMQFLKNEWKLPNYPFTLGSPLNECRGAYYQKDKKKSLPDDTRDTLELQNIPTLIFEGVPESRLRKIFELYNVTGMKLNAAEIRNAVYQSNPIHKVLYVLAGEGDGRSDLGVGGIPIQKAFADKFRAIYGGSRKRYQGVDFLARYLGYSRAVQRPGVDQFRLPSTSTAINNFFDYQSAKENPEAVAQELIDVMDSAEKFFDLDTEQLAFFVRSNKGQRQFNKLLATTHMIGARFLLTLIRTGVVTEAAAQAAASAVAAPPPEKQQRATIWDYQARILIGLRANLEVDTSALGGSWSEFFEKMEYCLLPPTEGA